MGVDKQHPQYTENFPIWEKTRACSMGQEAIKKLGIKVLPPPGAKIEGNNLAYDEVRYSQYKERAQFVNITGKTVEGLTGAAFRLPVQVDMPSTIDYLESDADGTGQGVEMLAKSVFRDVLETGRDGLLADYPQTEEGMTAEQTADLRASIKTYKAEDIINWNSVSVGGRTVITLVVLRETYDANDDEFTHDKQYQYRVLRLRDIGYTQQVYQKEVPITGEMPVKDFSGTVFQEIPFAFIGSESNDPDVDKTPMSDIANVNIGHYRNSADLEENCFVHGQLTLGISSSLDGDEFTRQNPDGVQVGSNRGHFLGEGGSFTSVQADPNQLADKLMERKEQQALGLGARLVEQRNPNETAAAAKIDATGQNSVLSDLVANVESAFIRSIEWCAQFMGESQDFTLKLNRSFFDDGVDPQLLMASIQGYDRAVIAKSDLQNVFRKSGVIESERTNEDIDSETGQANPLE